MGETPRSPGVALERAAATAPASGEAGAPRSGPLAGHLAEIEEHRQWPLLSRLPLKLEVAVPMPGFRVRDLLGLRPGQRLPSAWASTEDVPLTVGGVQLGWSEFEVVEQRMAVRLTRLA